MTQQTKEAIHSSDFVKTTSGLLKGVKQYMNTSTAKAITGMPYCMTEPTEDHIWGKEYLKSTSTTHKLINMTHKLINMTFHLPS